MRKLIACLVCLIIPILVYALTLSQTGTEITVEYKEPSTNADGSPLDDLAKTTIFYQVDGEGMLNKDVPATSLTGGGTITETIVVPVLPMEQKNVMVWAQAYDLSGNSSVSTSTETIRIDRLPPAPPQ